MSLSPWPTVRNLIDDVWDWERPSRGKQPEAVPLLAIQGQGLSATVFCPIPCLPRQILANAAASWTQALRFRAISDTSTTTTQKSTQGMPDVITGRHWASNQTCHSNWETTSRGIGILVD